MHTKAYQFNKIFVLRFHFLKYLYIPQLLIKYLLMSFDFISNIWDSILKNYIKFDDKFWQSLVWKFEINFEKIEVWNFFLRENVLAHC